MKDAIFIVLAAAGAVVNGQATTAPPNPLESLLISASQQLSIAESSYGTKNPAWESVYSQAASEISAAISSLGTGTAVADEYSSIAADFSSAFGGPPPYSEITASGSALSSIIGEATSELASLSTDIASEVSEASVTNPVATGSNPVASYTANLANQVQAGALGAAGAAVLGLAAFCKSSFKVDGPAVTKMHSNVPEESSSHLLSKITRYGGHSLHTLLLGIGFQFY